MSMINFESATTEPTTPPTEPTNEPTTRNLGDLDTITEEETHIPNGEEFTAIEIQDAETPEDYPIRKIKEYNALFKKVENIINKNLSGAIKLANEIEKKGIKNFLEDNKDKDLENLLTTNKPKLIVNFKPEFNKTSQQETAEPSQIINLETMIDDYFSGLENFLENDHDGNKALSFESTENPPEYWQKFLSFFNENEEESMLNKKTFDLIMPNFKEIWKLKKIKNLTGKTENLENLINNEREKIKAIIGYALVTDLDKYFSSDNQEKQKNEEELKALLLLMQLNKKGDSGVGFFEKMKIINNITF